MTKREKILFCIALALFLILIAGAVIGFRRQTRQCQTVTVTTTDTLVVRDTLFIDRPVPVEQTRIKTVYLPVNDTVRLHDTLYVSIDRVQKMYEGHAYKAYISGIDPALDSLRLYPETRYVNTMVETVKVQKPKHWGVGVMAGYGISTQGLVPYIGIGLSYNIVTF